jgi:hypothetical protein
LSILGKIKNWWAAKREARREWWLKPLNDSLFEQMVCHRMAIDEVANHQLADRLDLDATLKYRLGAIDLKLEALKSRFETNDAMSGSRHAHYCSQLDEVKAELNGIRSRYKWVEDRYDDATKGNVPRIFDYDKRQ